MEHVSHSIPLCTVQGRNGGMIVSMRGEMKERNRAILRGWRKDGELEKMYGDNVEGET